MVTRRETYPMGTAGWCLLLLTCQLSWYVPLYIEHQPRSGYMSPVIGFERHLLADIRDVSYFGVLFGSSE